MNKTKELNLIPAGANSKYRRIKLHVSRAVGESIRAEMRTDIKLMADRLAI